MTTTGAATQLLTADDLLRLDAEGVRGELIRGVLHKMAPTGAEHAEIVMNIGFALGSFVRPRRLGRLAASDMGVRLERDPDTVREPDIGFTAAERLPLDIRVRGYLEIVPDLVVEVVSPNDDLEEVRLKALMWRDHGARLVWVVHPDPRTVDVYRADGTATTVGGDDALDGEDVLPGFTCPLSAVFEA